jgi:hypothetical protein
MEKPEAIGRTRGVGRRGRERAGLLLLLAVGVWLSASPSAHAEPTQEEVLRSIGRNVSQPVDSGRTLGVLAAVAGALVLLVIVGQRRGRRPAGPKVVHHHGKLLKEVLRSVPLKPAEVRQLKILAEQSRAAGDGGEPIQSPLTLVLCPSVLARAAQTKSDKVNPKVIKGLAKKLVARG